ncbi:MAG: proline--tRNA ligase [SAR202 cluster bacterium]|nr:proline--tRNA ligase [SAR202 cluster bacterium]
MLVSKLFGKTLRESPAEAELVSHKLMLRAGSIYQVGSGIYSYLPLAWRSLRKIEQVIREEMDAAGSQELRLSVLQPRELWDVTGRTAAFGPDLMTLKDRRERTLVVAPTHEEVLTSVVKANVNSYRDLPLILYQIHTKFRDEPRPRGGLIRVREFDMKDAYSFDADQEGLDRSYEAMVRAYKHIYARCGLDVVMVEADSGAIGGKDSHEFMLLADSGEDTVVVCSGCGYAANVEKAVSKKHHQAHEPQAPVELVHTPGVKTIGELAKFLGVPAAKTLKAVFYAMDGEVVVVAIRGDLDVNEVKLKRALKTKDLRLATPEEVAAAGLVAGSASPVGLKGRLKTVADDSVELGSNYVAGANRLDYHLKNVNYPRDFQIDVVADIALTQDGDACAKCGRPLSARRGIEVGHVFKLGTTYSEVMGARFLDKNGMQQPIIMGCYGIGLGRLLAAAIEQHHDEKGAILPAPIAPYHVWIAALNVESPEVAQAAEALHGALEREGVEVLYDDRPESAGVKLNDADLVGLPVRVVVSPRNLKQGVVEVKERASPDAIRVAVGEAPAKIKELVSAGIAAANARRM